MVKHNCLYHVCSSKTGTCFYVAWMKSYLRQVFFFFKKVRSGSFKETFPLIVLVFVRNLVVQSIMFNRSFDKLTSCVDSKSYALLLDLV